MAGGGSWRISGEIAYQHVEPNEGVLRAGLGAHHDWHPRHLLTRQIQQELVNDIAMRQMQDTLSPATFSWRTGLPVDVVALPPSKQTWVCVQEIRTRTTNAIPWQKLLPVIARFSNEEKRLVGARHSCGGDHRVVVGDGFAEARGGVAVGSATGACALFRTPVLADVAHHRALLGGDVWPALAALADRAGKCLDESPYKAVFAFDHPKQVSPRLPGCCYKFFQRCSIHTEAAGRRYPRLLKLIDSPKVCGFLPRECAASF